MLGRGKGKKDNILILNELAILCFSLIDESYLFTILMLIKGGAL